MNAQSITRYLRQLCRDIDEGRPLRRYCVTRGASLAASIPIALAIGAGASAGCVHRQVVVYGAPQDPVEICDDGMDNDGDDRVDCADADCAEFEACLAVPEYGAPVMPDEPMPVPEYAAAFEPGDEPDPGAVAEYAVPFEPGDEPDPGAVAEYAVPFEPEG